jgi:hypothetical protein
MARIVLLGFVLLSLSTQSAVAHPRLDSSLQDWVMNKGVAHQPEETARVLVGLTKS